MDFKAPGIQGVDQRPQLAAFSSCGIALERDHHGDTQLFALALQRPQLPFQFFHLAAILFF